MHFLWDGEIWGESSCNAIFLWEEQFEVNALVMHYFPQRRNLRQKPLLLFPLMGVAIVDVMLRDSMTQSCWVTPWWELVFIHMGVAMVNIMLSDSMMLSCWETLVLNFVFFTMGVTIMTVMLRHSMTWELEFFFFLCQGGELKIIAARGILLTWNECINILFELMKCCLSTAVILIFLFWWDYKKSSFLFISSIWTSVTYVGDNLRRYKEP